MVWNVPCRGIAVPCVSYLYRYSYIYSRPARGRQLPPADNCWGPTSKLLDDLVDVRDLVADGNVVLVAEVVGLLARVLDLGVGGGQVLLAVHETRGVNERLELGPDLVRCAA